MHLHSQEAARAVVLACIPESPPDTQRFRSGSAKRRKRPTPAQEAAALRAFIGGTIDHLIALLDALDGDPDLEPDEDAEHDGREPDVDDEPSLAGNHSIDQRQWTAGGDHDREEEHDGCERRARIVRRSRNRGGVRG